MRTTVGQPVRLVDYRVPDFLIDSVDLDISLDRNATRVVSTLAVRPNPAGRPDVALTLDGDDLTLVSAELDGAPLDREAFEASPSQFVLPNPPRGAFTLKIETRLDPAANTKLMGLYRSGSAYCTQCEAEGFRRITYFLDRPDVLSTYRVRLEADREEAPVLLDNGNLESRGRSETGGRHWAVWADPHKKPCYLFALVAGDLAHIADTFVTASGRRVDLAIYAEPAARSGRITRWTRSSARWPGTKASTAANTTSTCSTSSPSPTSIWGRWRTRASTSSTTSMCSRRRRPRPTTITPASRASSRTNISTTGPATGSPAATGSSSASRRA